VAEAVRRARSLDMRPVEWRDGTALLVDQRKLPLEERIIEARDVDTIVRAIRSMAVRGAPLIGIVASYGLAIAAANSEARGPKALLKELDREAARLVASRPTAVNLAWAVQRVVTAAAEASVGATGRRGVEAIRRATLDSAFAVAREEEVSCDAIGRFGAELVPDVANVLTHCNTGALATGGIGTAQGVITTAFRDGKKIHVWVDETRPVLQGARLTAWELQRAGVPMSLVADTAPGSLMARGLVDLVVVGADRIAANGDVANKVGTYQLAVLSAHHGIPFFVAAPLSTVDLATSSGRDIPIENRNPDEVTVPLGVRFAPEGTWAVNPAFDVTPAALVTAIVTDRGVARAPYRSSLRRMVSRAGPRLAPR
jgi:methylthioribose-1-phosphate isomerase